MQDVRGSGYGIATSNWNTGAKRGYAGKIVGCAKHPLDHYRNPILAWNFN